MNTPKPDIIIYPTIMLIIIGALVGTLFGMGANPTRKEDIYYYVGGGILSALIVAMTPEHGIVFRLLRVLFPERFVTYENTSLNVFDDEPHVIAIQIEKGITYTIKRLDVPLEDWQKIASAVSFQKRYNQGIYETIFGQTEGRNIYRLVSAQLETAEILTPYGNGYNITGNGAIFFEKLAKGDWRVLNEIPEGDR